MSEAVYVEDGSKAYRMSFMAYVRPVAIFLVFFLISVSISQSQSGLASLAGYVLIVLSIINFYCSFKFISTLKLYHNADGVFLYRGIFPWTKGVAGTLWRDISDAEYFTGFVSWSTKSYRVRVGHRFTKTSELIIPHVKNGNQAVIEINEIIKAKERMQHS